MADTKTRGADFMMDGLTEKALAKRPAVKINSTGELDIDGAVALMDSKKDGEALRAGLDKAVSALDALRKTGLTGECLVLLVQAKCGYFTAGKRQPSAEVVQGVLEALFRLGEYTR